MTRSSSKQSSSIYDFIVKDIHGKDVDLSDYKGKVLLIANVANVAYICEQNEVYKKKKDPGLEITAFSCNQFGGQEPGFPKVKVNGNNAATLHKFLKSSKSRNSGDIEWTFGRGIKCNFTKFLVDKHGNVVKRYVPTTSQLTIQEDVKKLLAVA